MTLSDIAPGSGFTVSRVKISGETGKRLADMGFTEGAGGFMVRGAFMRGPLQVRIRGYDLLMRRGEAACIEVEEAPTVAPVATAVAAPSHAAGIAGVADTANAADIAGRPVAEKPKPVRSRRGPGGGLRRFFAADDCCGGGSGKKEPIMGGGRKSLLVALAGNPNSGKTSLFNALTGAHHKVGNYPGVTVEKREGTIAHRDVELRIVDLPGIYSLTAYSLDEVVTRDFMLDEKPDIVIDVLDSTNLERNLYLCLQFQELGIPMVAALNMSDEAEAKGLHIDAGLLSSALGVPMVKNRRERGQGDPCASRCGSRRRGTRKIGQNAAIRRRNRRKTGTATGRAVLGRRIRRNLPGPMVRRKASRTRQRRNEAAGRAPGGLGGGCARG